MQLALAPRNFRANSMAMLVGYCASSETQARIEITKLLECVSPQYRLRHHNPHHHQHLRRPRPTATGGQVDEHLHCVFDSVGGDQSGPGGHHMEHVAAAAVQEQRRPSARRPRESHGLERVQKSRPEDHGCCLTRG